MHHLYQLLQAVPHRLWMSLLALAAASFLTLQKLFPLVMLTPPFSPLQHTDIRRASVDLTSAQILALNGTPVQVVPAPGVGFQIVPLILIVTVYYGAAAYTNAGGGFPEMLIGSAAYVTTDAAVFLTGTAGRRTQTMQFAEVLNTAAVTPTSENAPLNFSKATAEFAAGTGTARVTVYYTIEPTA